MATFLVNMANHNEIGQRSLEDVVGIMGHQMRALGHQIVWETKNQNFVTGPGTWNIIVEGFTPSAVEWLADGYRRGARFIILATEEPHEKGFNQGTSDDMILRQRVFPDAAKYADGIIHLVPGKHVTDWYGQFAPTVYAELGYAPSLVRPTNPVPDWDFGFYGSFTHRRKTILKRLARKNGSELYPNNAADRSILKHGINLMVHFGTQSERDAEMQRARVLIQLRKFPSMGLVSSSRLATSLCLHRPVIAEPHLLSKPWDQIVTFTATEEAFYDAAILMRTAWKGVHAAQFEKFKRMLTPEFCIGEPLDRLGILGQRAARRLAS